MKPIAVWLTVLGSVLLLGGCKGIPTPAERQARAQQSSVAATYRPNGHRPPLPALGPDVSLSNYLAFALLNQPAIEAAYYDWSASIERITVARSLPDPQLTFQMDIQDVVTSIMPGLMLNLPGPGKLRAGAAVASAESETKFHLFQASLLQSAFEVKRAFYQLYFLDEKIRVNRETLLLLTNLEQLARVQNEVGRVTLQDVLRAQIEQERVKTETENLEDSRRALLADFKAALGLKPTEADPPVPRDLESTPLELTADQVTELALESSTRIRTIRSEVKAAEAAINLAHKAAIPDSSIGAMADVKMNPVLYRPLATVTLPIWRDKLAAQIAEAEANRRGAEARLTGEQIALAVAVAEKTFAYREATRNLALLQGQLLPKQRQSLEVARSGYLSGQIDFFNLTDAEQTLLRFSMEEIQARIQRELSLAELSLIVQGMTPSGAATVGPATASSVLPGAKRPGGGSMNSMK